MNTSTILSFVSSLVFILIKGDFNDTYYNDTYYNDTNISTTNQDIHELMDDFTQSLIRLYTEKSTDSLHEIIEYLDADDQELCYVAQCIRKENSENPIHDYLELTLGTYIDAKVTFDTKIRSSPYSADSGYFVSVNSAEYKTQMIDNQVCESFEMMQYIFLLNPDLYIMKWIIIPSSPMNLGCESVEPLPTDHDQQDEDGDNDNDDDEVVSVCPPEEFCEVTDGNERKDIMHQIGDHIMEITPDTKVENIQKQVLDLSQGYGIRVILEKDGDDVVVTYFVRSDGMIDMESVKINAFSADIDSIEDNFSSFVQN